LLKVAKGSILIVDTDGALIIAGIVIPSLWLDRRSRKGQLI
jgi:hypothetical protein